MQEVQLDIQEINLNDGSLDTNKEITIDSGSSANVDLKEANFGSGIELLMNDKVKNSTKKSPSSNSLNELESELNAIDNNAPSIDSKDIQYKEKDSFQNKPVIEIAKATSTMETKTETWDGFKDINSIHF